MPKLSTNAHDSAETQLDLVFQALSDRTRRAQLARLREGPARVTELAEPFEMSLPAISKHLKVLESAGLIRRDIEGRVHHCSLRPETLKEASQWLIEYRSFWEGTLDALAAYVEEDKES